jgi:ketosteroid isomerase-like protein
MSITRKLIMLLLLCSGSALAAPPPQSLVQAEYAFGHAVKLHGLREGFLMYLDDHAIAFAPQPTDAKTFYASRNPGPSTLSWYPVMARIAASGDFGFTTGPWQVSYTTRDGKPATAHGDYATIWHREADGSWRWLLDAGVPLEARAGKAVALPDSGDSKTYAMSDATRANAAAAAKLADLDVRYTELATHVGMRAVYKTLGSTDLRVLQFQSQPLVGRAAVLKHTPMEKAGLQWIMSGSDIASSNDLGYTYGMAYPVNGDRGRVPQSVYVHIWKHTKHGWRLLLDLENALPPPRAP